MFKIQSLTLPFALLCTPLAHGQSINENAWIAANTIRCMERTDSILFLGGNMIGIGPNTGTFALVDRTNGDLYPGFLDRRTSEHTEMAVKDGQGGFFVGGWFGSIGDEPRTLLARFDPLGHLMSWSVDIEGAYIHALLVSGDTLFIGGNFTAINGIPRSGLGAVSISSGVLLDWDPGCDGIVDVLLLHEGRIYTSGFFTSIGGAPRFRFGVLDPTTGAALPLEVVADETPAPLGFVGDTLYIGGVFSVVNGDSIRGFAAVDINTGNVLDVDLDLDGNVYVMDIDGDSLTISGTFWTINGQPHYAIGRVHRSTGAVSSWDPQMNGWALSMVRSGDTLFLAGTFSEVAGQAQNQFAAIAAANGTLFPWDPGGSGYAHLWEVSDSTMLVSSSGTYPSLGLVRHQALAALDPHTGVGLPFDVSVNGNVYCLRAYGDTLFIGGNFDMVAGQPRDNLAAILISSGVLLPWTPDPNFGVYAFEIAQDQLFVGGFFTYLAGSPRRRLASFNLPSLGISVWGPTQSGDDLTVRCLRTYGGHLYVGGDINEIAATPRSNIASFNLATGFLDEWAPEMNDQVLDIEGHGPLVYAAGEFATVNGEDRRGVAALDTITGALDPWHGEIGSNAMDIEIRDSMMMVADSHGWWPGQEEQYGFNVVSLADGAHYSIGPNIDQHVRCLTWTEDAIYLGGDFETVDGRYRPSFVMLSDLCLLPQIVDVTNATCLGSGIDGSASVFVSGGAAPYTFTWDSQPPQNTADLNAVPTGIYTLTITDSDTCAASLSTYINGPTLVGDLDLWATLHTTNFRPTVTSYIYPCLGNNGCVSTNGSLTVVLDPLVEYVEATPPPTSINGNTLVWSIPQLNYDSSAFCPVIEVLGSELANIGDTICITAWSGPSDIDPNNDLVTRCREVINSYDPNIKEVSPEGIGPQGFIPPNTTLTYSIGFQNTGNAPAIDVLLVDTISPMLEFGSLQVLEATHSLTVEVDPASRILRFNFQNIMLPDSSSDEPNSHGHVTYRIDMVSGLSDGIIVENTAYIYFDFNPAIVTNTVLNTIDLASDVPTHQADELIAYPNPTGGPLTIAGTRAPVRMPCQVFDARGNRVELPVKGTTGLEFDLRALPAGLYTIVCGEHVSRVIKQ